MDFLLLARVLLHRRAAFRRREKWTRAWLDQYRAHALAKLRAFAYARSRFYRERHAGLFDAPLSALPAISKRELMEHFDATVTDPSVTLAAARKYLERNETTKFLGRYQVSRTAGTTGFPGIFVSDPVEWATTVASYERAQRWAGIHASLLSHTPLAMVSSGVMWHQSTRVGASVASPFITVARFDANDPLPEIVAGLNAAQPANLIAYASMARLLADEQIAGRLHISPRAVMATSEVLSEEGARLIERAWGRPPFDTYATTDASGLASHCARHRMHLYDDLVIVEVVDDRNQPVPDGTYGAKVLVTVLDSRTLPIIRYEISDSVARSTRPCDCGLPFDVLDGIRGRQEEIVELKSPAGTPARIHPVLFHQVLESFDLRDWQVRAEVGGLTVNVFPRESVDLDAIRSKLRAALEHAGAAAPEIRLGVVEGVERTAFGKAPRVLRGSS